jgi:hypothetical protein
MGKKFGIDEEFFDTWSKNMAYVLGYIYADGNLIDDAYMRGKYISIASTDRDSIDRIRKWLQSEHTVLQKKSPFSGGKICFVLRIGSHKMYNSLFKLGLHPNKSLTTKFPAIPSKYLSDFIRGYFDGDGCIYFEKRNGQNGTKIIKRIRTIFTSGSKEFIEKMDDAFKRIGVESGKIYLSKRAYQSVYNTIDSVQLFKLMYKDTSTDSFFMRKFKIFKEYFELRPSRADTVIHKILKFHDGHVVK